MIDIPDEFLSKDADGNILCFKCGKRSADCSCQGMPPPLPAEKKRVFPHIRIEKSGRSGKTVTIISNLPEDEVYLKDLSRGLKARTGAGGTFYISEGKGIVELQGDQKKHIGRFFQEKT